MGGGTTLLHAICADQRTHIPQPFSRNTTSWDHARQSVAVFDEGLESHIDSALGGLPRSYRPVLDGRIRFLSDQGLISNGLALHRVRHERNAVAHGSSSTTTWDHVGIAIDDMEAALLMLGLVKPRPKLEYFGERSAIEIGDTPGVLGTRTFTIGVRQDDVVAYEARWEERLHRLDPGAAGLE